MQPVQPSKDKKNAPVKILHKYSFSDLSWVRFKSRFKGIAVIGVRLGPVAPVSVKLGCWVVQCSLSELLFVVTLS